MLAVHRNLSHLTLPMCGKVGLTYGNSLFYWHTNFQEAKNSAAFL